MAKFPEDRMAVLSPSVLVPSIEVLEGQFTRFWAHIRRNLNGETGPIDLNYSDERTVKSLAATAYKRRLREAGLGSIKPEVLGGVIDLAQKGGKLLGPSTDDDVHLLVAALHTESGWMRDVSTWIMHQMLRHIAAGGRGLALPPVILAGPPGIGKSHYAKSIARIAGLPSRMIDIGGGSAGFRISGTERGWSTEQPGVPVETLLATRVANPIMVIDEVDKAGTVYSKNGSSSSITTSLLQMLEPNTARHFECPFHRLPFDMSRVVWIMTANDVDRIPAPLRDRSRLFILPKLPAADAISHFDRLARGCGDEAGRDKCQSFIARMSDRPEGIGLRQIQHLVDALTAPGPQMMH